MAVQTKHALKRRRCNKSPQDQRINGLLEQENQSFHANSKKVVALLFCRKIL